MAVSRIRIKKEPFAILKIYHQVAGNGQMGKSTGGGEWGGENGWSVFLYSELGNEDQLPWSVTKPVKLLSFCRVQPHKHFIGLKRLCPCLLCITSVLPREESGHFTHVESLLLTTPFRYPPLLTLRDSQPYFSSPRKTVKELIFKIFPLSASSISNTWNSGAVLFFLLLPSPKAMIPCVLKFSYHGDDSRYKSGWRFCTGRELGGLPLTLEPVWTGSLEMNTIMLKWGARGCLCLCVLWSFLCLMGGWSLNSFCWVPK